ncbi:hypothetical protein Ais01nite_24050 [Asanoa ishikariensis]|uniref:Uncharacterized protein n=1 Tax=Asanoa ishikariensis TaxID=137265 RepID=A0A1H3R8C7_9ACTN|nr:hypothetical protein [Asanoa ishikariensis]GIF64370.1 hypothetical protein Ais01nite_24050 [Asanoa ishikariensis]SDZ21219.1 hypothetical protein SAMN05421684_3514 [Asanoa ishikariensis]
MNRVSAAGLVLALAAGLALLGVGDPTPSLASQDVQSGGADTGSAMTVHGRKTAIEDFSGLAVTVSQTRDLTNQAVEVSWTGGVPSPRTRSLGFDYLQIMQCWGDPGDDENDPDGLAFRETCQFGMNLPSPFTGRSGATSQAANSRSMTLGLANYPSRDEKEVAPKDVDDPATKDVDERDAPGTLRTDAKMIPFRTVQGIRFRDGSPYKPYRMIINPATGNTTEETDVDVLRESFAEPSTNEVPWALTSGDGTGRAVFEIQDAGRAPDLGCGAPTVERNGKSVAGPKCSLVIVPRGRNNPYTGEQVNLAEGAVHGSPFLPANWVNRIVVPLDFRPVTGLCPLGLSERRTAGTEMVAEAVTAWQPGVCANNGPLIGYSAIGDGEAARQVLLTGAGSPGLVFTADPVVPGLGQPPVVHAPATLSGIEIAMNVDANIVDPNQADGKVPPEVLAMAGSALKDVKLTPRLIAKLLTQTYRNDAKDPDAFPNLPNGHKAANPASIRDDPEFRVINPVFDWWDRTQSSTLDGLMVSLGNSAGSRQVWRWLLADPEAGPFLAGKPDENGIVINKWYKGLTNTGLDTFPKADPKCTEVTFDKIAYPHCTQNLRPYLGSMSEAALQTLRADTKGRLPVFNELTLPPNYDPVPRRAPGYRFAMSITESASAARYGLFPAQLCKPLRDTKKKLLAGVDCRTPTDTALQKAAGTAQSSTVPGVKVIDPTVAWKTPGAYPLAMINYAVGNLWEQADARKDYAALLRQIAGEGQQPGLGRGQLPEGYAPLPQDLRSQTMNAAALLEFGSPTPPPPSSLTPPPGVPATGLPPSLGPVAASPAPPIARASATTPGGPMGMMRNLLIIVLVVGLVGGVIGPVLKRMGAGRGGPSS